ncbi:MAG: hypothetical protein GXP54_04225 [Deltaproteobacteria bacterium]|nr:hypothetical protein [Deltaproteobacteria bacterium]
MRALFMGCFLAATLSVAPGIGSADTVVSLKDPVHDDDGPGTYKYPTDPVYKPGTFDITSFAVKTRGSDVIFKVTVRSKIKDPWNSRSWDGNGFSLQFAQVYIDTDHKQGSGFCDGLPGLNVKFRKESCWEKVVLISPQGKSRLKSEVKQKAAAMKDGVVYPRVTRVKGRTLEAVVRAKDLGGRPAKGWGWQVVMQSNEGYPGRNDLLTRKVNEYAGKHRFVGGSDWNCDPQVIDILMAPGAGTEAEKEAQHRALKFRCNEADPDKSPLVELPMVYP